MNDEQFGKARQLHRKIDDIKYSINSCTPESFKEFSGVRWASDSVLEKCRVLMLADLEEQLEKLQLEFRAL